MQQTNYLVHFVLNMTQFLFHSNGINVCRKLFPSYHSNTNTSTPQLPQNGYLRCRCTNQRCDTVYNW